MNNIKEIRMQHGMTQAQVARELNISRQAYYNYETGKREADYETLLRLGELFGCSVEELIMKKATGTNADRQKTVFISYKSSDANAFTELLSQLSDTELKQVYDYARFLVAQTKSEKGK